jgi:hypothetical protein
VRSPRPSWQAFRVFTLGLLALLRARIRQAFRALSSRATGWSRQSRPRGEGGQDRQDCAAERIWNRAQALLWYYTGNETYAQGTIAILNAWQGLQGFTAGTDQDRLQAGWIGAVLAPADRYDVFEIGYNHHPNRMGIDLPSTLAQIAKLRSGSGIQWTSWNLVYETLTHADVP